MIDQLRRLFICSCVLAPWLLCWTGEVRAQSCTGYSANVVFAALLPADAAKLGITTATLTATAKNGGVPSHIYSAFNGTETIYTATSHNGSSGNLYVSINGGARQLLASGLSITLDSAGWWGAGNTAVFTYVVIDSNGNATQDQVTENVFNGPPGIVYQDGIPTNVIVRVTINFGGGSMLNNCSECQTGNSQQCINATHTPYVTLTAVNHTQGISVSVPRQIAGNVAKSNESVSGTGSVFIAANPNDTVDGTANGEIFCTMFGDLPVSGNDDWGIDWELAWTKFSTIQSSCLPAGGNPPSIGCKVTSKYMCNTNSQPADLQVLQVFAEYDTNGNPVTLETVPPFWWGWGFGIRGHISMFKTPWIFPANVLQQYKVGDISSWAHVVLEVAAGSFPSNSTIRKCTNKDAGTSPEVVPPFDQP